MVGLLLGCQHSHCWILAKVTCKKLRHVMLQRMLMGPPFPSDSRKWGWMLNYVWYSSLLYIFVCYIYILHNISQYIVLQPCTYCNRHFKPYSIDAAVVPDFGHRTRPLALGVSCSRKSLSFFGIVYGCMHMVSLLRGKSNRFLFHTILIGTHGSTAYNILQYHTIISVTQ